MTRGATRPNPATSRGADWFEHAVLGVLPDLLGTAVRLTKSPADAEDLVADAVAQAWLKRDSLVDRSRFHGWIFRILTNQYLGACRARAGRPQEESLAEYEERFSLFDQLHQPFLLWWSNPEQEFLGKLLREDLQAAVDSLPDVFRLVVILADVQGLSYREIAVHLGVPVGTVRSRLARGRSLLQKALWQQACDAGIRKGAADQS
ncbi:MAG: sigma-70 family RNA polymerase sigma factor [Gemmatimonadales bacterium]